MRRADKLHASLCDRPRRGRLELCPDLVDDDDLGHVIFHRLDHHLVLQRRGAHLHAAGLPDCRMGDVAVACNLVRGVDHDDVGQHARGFAEHGGLADAWPAHDQDRLTGLDEVLDDLDRAVDRAPDPAGQADDLAAPIADGADAMQGALDAGAVVVAKRADVLDHIGDVAIRHLAFEEDHLAVGKARLGWAAQIQDDLDQGFLVGQLMDRLDDVGRQGSKEDSEVVD